MAAFFFATQIKMSYLVCEFSKPTVTNLVKECFGSDFPDIFTKPQLEYLYHYLKDLGAQSVLLEREYLDKDYLEDYLRYYAKCFKNSGHKCARLHFFSSELDHSTVNDALVAGPASAHYQTIATSYLGFIVVKPLPMTFIGKTCLKTYPAFRQRDTGKVCISQTYEVDLFGIRLKIDSVAFQEQDKVVSACATTAIWIALHAFRRDHEKQIPSCSEITGNAINHIVGSNNSFPNKGLTNKQILRALDVAGFRYYNESLKGAAYQPDSFFETVKFHVDSKIPLILGADLYKKDEPEEKTCDTSSVEAQKNGPGKDEVSNGDSLRGHAVTIVGYSCNAYGRAVYIHDDRLGPFAKATFQTMNGRTGLALQCKAEDGTWQDPHELLVPTGLIIATNKKARIPYVLPRNTCRMILNEFEIVLNELGADAVAQFSGKLKYSLTLSQVSEVRQELIAAVPQTSAEVVAKVRFLSTSYARFQWVARFALEDSQAFMLMFDATDIPQGNAVSGLHVIDWKNSAALLDRIEKVANHPKSPKLSENENFFGALLRYLRRKPSGLHEHLDRRYGELRAPKYLKPQEFPEGNIAVNTSRRCFYEQSTEVLADLYVGEPKLLWAIAEDGGLLIGLEHGDQGHPTLTGFRPARIAGELIRADVEMDSWKVNNKSGRYSGDYSNKDELLANAVVRLKGIFPRSDIGQE